MRSNHGGDLSRDGGAKLLSRREVLIHGAAGAAFVCSLGGVAKLTSAPSGKPGPVRRAEAEAAFAPFQVDVPQMPVLEPVDTSGGVDRYEITMQEGEAEILNGIGPTPILGYDGIFPGPTIRSRRGRPVEVEQTNNLSADTSVHLHGGHQPEESDGALHEYHINPGGQRTYHYPNAQPEATLWYHDHVHGLVGPHLNYGLLGCHIIESPNEANMGLPQGEYDVPLMITDRSFRESGTFYYPAGVADGFLGDTILVNGAIVPRMRVKRRIYRLRFVNASNAREYRLRLGNGRTMHQIGADTALLDKPYGRSAITITPGERADVLVDFKQFRPGSQLILQNTHPSAAEVPSAQAVMRLDVEGGGGREQFRIPKALRWPEPIPSPERSREITLELTGETWTINGQPFDAEQIDVRPKLLTTEDWTFVNNSTHAHPMHIHDAHFRILSVNGQQPHPAERGWKDTVNVPPESGGQPGTAVIRVYFKNHTGRFVFHCHTAEHSDRSMMTMMEIEP
ncbi:MAG TPA: multicopper oxidase family protein [Solirubrobacterales bacterium]|nr:multicopper oxidase family protein [Solirubrobacterales bacterium]